MAGETYKRRKTPKEYVIDKVITILGEDWSEEGTKELILEDLLGDYFQNFCTHSTMETLLRGLQVDRK